MPQNSQPAQRDRGSSLPLARALVGAYDAFRKASDPHVESMGLSPAHFDILATLGDEPGMTCKEVGERTLLTKGTLSGHLARLEEKGLIRRVRGEEDTRQIIVSLTPEGQEVFEATFYPHIAYMKARFDRLPDDKQALLARLLRELRTVLAHP